MKDKYVYWMAFGIALVAFTLGLAVSLRIWHHTNARIDLLQERVEDIERMENTHEEN